MKKQLCTLCLALLLLIPGAGTFCSAAEAERAYTCSCLLYTSDAADEL